MVVGQIDKRRGNRAGCPVVPEGRFPERLTDQAAQSFQKVPTWQTMSTLLMDSAGQPTMLSQSSKWD